MPLVFDHLEDIHTLPQVDICNAECVANSSATQEPLKLFLSELARAVPVEEPSLAEFIRLFLTQLTDVNWI